MKLQLEILSNYKIALAFKLYFLYPLIIALVGFFLMLKCLTRKYEQAKLLTPAGR